MSGRRAKALRRQVYGDGSTRGGKLRRRKVAERIVPYRDKVTGELLKDDDGNVKARRFDLFQVVADEKRRAYQGAKRGR